MTEQPSRRETQLAESFLALPLGELSPQVTESFLALPLGELSPQVTERVPPQWLEDEYYQK